ncbi:hypothetical protein T439DRAFT_357586 [Meredithblackwellia eburnea MCA 4105]
MNPFEVMMIEGNFVKEMVLKFEELYFHKGDGFLQPEEGGIRHVELHTVGDAGLLRAFKFLGPLTSTDLLHYEDYNKTELENQPKQYSESICKLLRQNVNYVIMALAPRIPGKQESDQHHMSSTGDKKMIEEGKHDDHGPSYGRYASTLHPSPGSQSFDIGKRQSIRARIFKKDSPAYRE